VKDIPIRRLLCDLSTRPRRQSARAQ
jgi:hypothetical protein